MLTPDLYEFHNIFHESDISYESIVQSQNTITKLCDITINNLSTEGVKDFFIKIWNFFKEFIRKIVNWIKRIFGNIFNMGPVRKAVKVARYPFNLRYKNYGNYNTLIENEKDNVKDVRQFVIRSTSFYNFSFNDKLNMDQQISGLSSEIKNFSNDFQQFGKGDLNKFNVDSNSLNVLNNNFKVLNEYINNGTTGKIVPEIKSGVQNSCNKLIEKVNTLFCSINNVHDLSKIGERYDEVVGVKEKIPMRLFHQHKVNKRYEFLNEIVRSLETVQKTVESVDVQKLEGNDPSKLRDTIKILTGLFKNLADLCKQISSSIYDSAKQIISNHKRNKEFEPFADELTKNGTKNISIRNQNDAKKYLDHLYRKISEPDRKEILDGLYDFLSNSFYTTTKYSFTGYDGHPFFVSTGTAEEKNKYHITFACCVTLKVGLKFKTLVFIDKGYFEACGGVKKFNDSISLKGSVGHEYGHTRYKKFFYKSKISQGFGKIKSNDIKTDYSYTYRKDSRDEKHTPSVHQAMNTYKNYMDDQLEVDLKYAGNDEKLKQKLINDYDSDLSIIAKKVYETINVISMTLSPKYRIRYLIAMYSITSKTYGVEDQRSLALAELVASITKATDIDTGLDFKLGVLNQSVHNRGKISDEILDDIIYLSNELYCDLYGMELFSIDIIKNNAYVDFATERHSKLSQAMKNNYEYYLSNGKQCDKIYTFRSHVMGNKLEQPMMDNRK